MKNILLIYNLIPNNKTKFFFWFCVILTIVKSLIDFISLGSLVPFLYVIFDQQKLVNSEYLKFLNLEQYTEVQIVYFSVFIIFSIFLVKNIFVLFQNYIAVSFVNSVYVSLSDKIVTNSIDLYHGNSKYNSSEIFKFLHQELSNYSFKYLSSIFSISSDIFFILIFLIFIGFQHNAYTLVFLLPMFLIALIYYQIIKNYTLSIGNKRLLHDSQRIKGIREVFEFIKVIKVLNKIDNFLNFIKKNTIKSAIQVKKLTIMNKVFQIIVEMTVISIVCFSVLIFSNNLKYFQNFLSLFIFVFISSIKLLPMISRLTISLQKIKFGQDSLKKLYDFANKKVKIRFKEKNIISFKKNIQIKNFNFSYSNKSKIFKNLNLNIKKNDCIGIVGKSGSGKTTLLEIICGILENIDGEIFVDKKKLNYDKFRLKVSYVSQETKVLNSSFRQNITLNLKQNDSSFDKHRYLEAIKKSNLVEFVNNLPKKHQSIIGEFGSSISGGQRQRMGIARALYHNSEILVLDEFTSSLDDVTEKKILKDLKLIKNLKTIIISTHKREILDICDKVLKIKNKKLELYDNI